MRANRYIVLENVSKSYFSGGRRIDVLEKISLTINKNEFISIVGPMGCGKTTLLNIINGITSPSSGRVLIDGKEVAGVQRNMALIFQETGLFPWMTALENAAFGLKIRKVKKSERLEVAKKYLRLVGLEGFENYYPSRLSGGMQQRVGIARAYAIDPEILLLDEPFGHLDAQTRWYMEEELRRIWSVHKKTAILVTNIVEEAVYLGDRVVVLTQRPAKVKAVIDVDVPRDRTHPDFLALRKKIEDMIEASL